MLRFGHAAHQGGDRGGCIARRCCAASSAPNDLRFNPPGQGGAGHLPPADESHGEARITTTSVQCPARGRRHVHGCILNVLDGILVYRFLEAGALAAVSLAFPFAMAVSALSTQMGGGMSSLMARHLGGAGCTEADCFPRFLFDEIRGCRSLTLWKQRALAEFCSGRVAAFGWR